MDIVTVLGVAGAGTILVAFLLNQFGKWSSESRSYDLVNVLGSGLLMGYSYLLGSWPFLILNTVWFLVSLKDVLKSFR